MQMILRECTFDCICKTRHAEKFTSVLADIRAVNYMLYWVVSFILTVFSFQITDVHLIVNSALTPLPSAHGGYEERRFHEALDRVTPLEASAWEAAALFDHAVKGPPPRCIG